jgi:hypothetical protein
MATKFTSKQHTWNNKVLNSMSTEYCGYEFARIGSDDLNREPITDLERRLRC